MTCPHYDPNNRTCGLKSEFYGELPSQTIKDYCVFEYASCDIFHNDLERRKSEVEEKVQQIEDSKKVSPGFLRKIVSPVRSKCLPDDLTQDASCTPKDN